MIVDFIKRKWIILCGLAIAALFLLGIRTTVPRDEAVVIAGYVPWPEEIIRQHRQSPLQDGGRLKPQLALARLQMLAIAGRQKLAIRDDSGRTHIIEPCAWMLDCLWRPHLAAQIPMFLVNNDEVLTRLGLKPHEKRRDRYAYGELVSALPELRLQASRLAREDEARMSLVDRQILGLARRVETFEALASTFAQSRRGILAGGADAPAPLPRTPAADRLSGWLANAALISTAVGKGGAPEWIRSMDRQFAEYAELSRRSPRMIPPQKPGGAWLSTGEAIALCLDPATPAATRKEISGQFACFESLALAIDAGNMEAFASALAKWNGDVAGREDVAPAVTKLALEVDYYRLDLLFWSFIACTFAFAAFCAYWLSPGTWWGRLCLTGMWAGCLAGLGGLIAAICLRSVIMSRPPVGNLYDTIPFITAGAMVVALILELFLRKRFAAFVGVTLGVLGCALAIQYEAGNPVDTMDPLVAVLRDNYWLTTHVITVTLGYSAGLLAAGIAQVYLLGRMTGLDGGDQQLRSSLTRMVYGAVCFCLLLSLVGTVLGGVWANDAWGRFWGWDPKENGALMIVLATLAILHARLAGWIGEFGLHVCATFCAVIIAFSWWYVNMLGVGLHSYGFTEGKSIVHGFFALETGVTLVALVWAKFRLRSTPEDTPKVAS